jgi:nucleoside-diphosphate-sugar epimerase
MADDLLITGAQGFIGRFLLPALAAAGLSFRALTRADGDLAQAVPAVPAAGCVIHLAAKTFVPESWQSPHSFYASNVMGTVNVLEFCRRHRARLILISSYVYGPPQYLPIDEDHPLAGFNPYAHTKLMAEEVARSYAQLHGLEVAIIRPFNIYGPGQEDRFLIPSILKQVLDPAQTVIRVADARPKRDYLFIEDLIRLIVAVFEKRATGVFNAGTGESFSVGEIAQLANRLTGQAKPLEDRGESRPAEVMDVYAAISRARRELDWSPRITLEDGMRRIIEAAA